jgi:hypothetical protein
VILDSEVASLLVDLPWKINASTDDIVSLILFLLCFPSADGGYGFNSYGTLAANGFVKSISNKMSFRLNDGVVSSICFYSSKSSTSKLARLILIFGDCSST